MRRTGDSGLPECKNGVAEHNRTFDIDAVLHVRLDVCRGFAGVCPGGVEVHWGLYGHMVAPKMKSRLPF